MIAMRLKSYGIMHIYMEISSYVLSAAHKEMKRLKQTEFCGLVDSLFEGHIASTVVRRKCPEVLECSSVRV
jgi:hypothetical protein